MTRSDAFDALVLAIREDYRTARANLRATDELLHGKWDGETFTAPATMSDDHKRITNEVHHGRARVVEAMSKTYDRLPSLIQRHRSETGCRYDFKVNDVDRG